MTKKNLIAAVLVTCYVAGVRTDIQPGEPVPELSPHDEAELKRMGAVIDPAAELAEERAEQKLADTQDAEFQAARSAVQAADASVAEASTGVTQPAAKKSAKKSADKAEGA